MFALTILGSNSALPAFGRNPTAQVLQTNYDTYLIDCGEGTQLQLSRYKIKRSRIHHVFISHLHGDHYFGLIGLINSMGLTNRTEDLHIHAPKGLEAIIRLQLSVADTILPYQIYFHELEGERVIHNDAHMEVSCFPVQHRIPCFGFLFREKRNPRSVDPDRAKAYEIPESHYHIIQSGKDYIHAKGTIIPNEEVTVKAPEPRSYAYCADTLFHEELAERVKDVDLIYHETTYLDELAEHATKRFHSTTRQAGAIAKLANAKKLLIGHFSSKYENLDAFLEETLEVFPNTELAVEGCCYKIQ